MMYRKASIMLLSRVVFSLACWGSSVDDSVDVNEEDKSMLNPHNKNLWGGWHAPSGAVQAWDEWLDAWNAQNKGNGGYLTEEDIKAGKKPEGHNIKDWPPDWQGMGPGFGGMGPPPWAYVPKNVGKPPKCYQPPDYGHCTSSYHRYGYNPYTDTCLGFSYSGCGGNQNNFLSLERCEEECVNPIMGCNPESGIPIEDIID